MPTILFVCTGNTCRSSLAEGLAKKLARENKVEVEVLSAGVAAWPGAPATPEAALAAGELGVDLREHRARQLSEELLEKADLILVMEERHKEFILTRYPQAREKTFTLREYAAGVRGDIEDPIGRPLEVYRACALELKELIDKALAKLASQKSLGTE